MIPSVGETFRADFNIKEESSKTFRMNHHRIHGYVDGLEAMKQAIYKILHTDRFRYLIYSWNYGVELSDLFGEPISFVCPELERRIEEALLTDTRIIQVGDFQFDLSKKGKVSCIFRVYTIFGDLKEEMEVDV